MVSLTVSVGQDDHGSGERKLLKEHKQFYFVYNILTKINKHYINVLLVTIVSKIILPFQSRRDTMQ